jgi:hypothetical protein
MTEKDQKLFELLRASSAGQLLVEYIGRSLAELCDLRKVAEKPGTKEYEVETAARLLAARHVEKLVCDPISLANKKKNGDNSQYE